MRDYWCIGVDPGAKVGLALMRCSLTAVPARRGPTLQDKLWVHSWSDAVNIVIAGWVAFIEGEEPKSKLIGVVERVEKVFPVQRRGIKGISSKMASALVHSTECAVEIRASLRPLCETVLEVPAAVWRRGLVGVSSPSDAVIARAIRGLYPSLGRSNAHERDAIGLARHGLIWARTLEGRRALSTEETKK
jgi:hypothetical protein